MTLVVDASAVVALVDDGPLAARMLTAGPLAAPHLLLVENILRQALLAE